MKALFAHIGPFPHVGNVGILIVSFSLILFVALVVTDATKSRDK